MPKPVCFFDLETTGTDLQKDRIVEIAIVKLAGDVETEFYSLVNPEMAIPPEASRVHGITDEQVASSPKLIDLLPNITSMLAGCDLAGYNSNSYDIPLLYNELLRVGFTLDLSDVFFYDACTIFKRREGRTLSDAVKFYTGEDHTGAHGAMADVRATINVLRAQRSRYTDLPHDREGLSLYCNYDNKRADISQRFIINSEGNYIFNFGKHRGKEAKTEPGYLQWIIDGDFSPDSKVIAKLILNSISPT